MKSKAKVVVVGGGVVGENAAIIATGMQAKVFIVDKSINRLDELKNNLDKDNIKFIQMSSLELENNFKNKSFDLIWIDGDHLNPQVTIDIFQCLKLIKNNGVICVDDILKDDEILKKGVNNEYISGDSFKTLEYFNNLGYLKTSYLLKRVSRRNLDGKKFISISSLKDLT